MTSTIGHVSPAPRSIADIKRARQSLVHQSWTSGRRAATVSLLAGKNTFFARWGRGHARRRARSARSARSERFDLSASLRRAVRTCACRLRVTLHARNFLEKGKKKVHADSSVALEACGCVQAVRDYVEPGVPGYHFPPFMYLQTVFQMRFKGERSTQYPVTCTLPYKDHRFSFSAVWWVSMWSPSKWGTFTFTFIFRFGVCRLCERVRARTGVCGRDRNMWVLCGVGCGQQQLLQWGRVVSVVVRFLLALGFCFCVCVAETGRRVSVPQ